MITHSSSSVAERFLTYTAIGVLSVSLISFFATLIVGLNNGSTLAEGVWPIMFALSLFGVPIGFALLITLLVIAQVRRRKATRRTHAG